MATYEMEAVHEALPELEGVLQELEGAAPVWRGIYGQGEGEAETEAFFENLAEYAAGGGGRGGGRSAGVPLASLAINSNTGGYIEGELEAELEEELGEASLEALMEHYGHAAAEAETEADAEAFLFPLLPLAAKFVLPKVASFAAKKVLPQLTRRVLPRLVRGTTQVMRTLRRNPATRPYVRMLPTIARRTMADIARQVERGRPVTPEIATRFLARETRRMLQDPPECVRVYRRSRALDRRYHHACRRVGY